MGKRENTYLNRGQCLFMPHLRKNASFRVCIPWRGRGSWAGATGARTGRMSHSAALSLSLSLARALSVSLARRAPLTPHTSLRTSLSFTRAKPSPALAHSGFGTDTLSLSPRCVRAPPVSLQAGRVRELRAAHPLRGGSWGQRGVKGAPCVHSSGLGCARVANGGSYIRRERASDL